MPYPWRKSFRKWEECPRCGLDYPKNTLRRDYTGAKVCPYCWDEEGADEHRRRINIKIEELDQEETLEVVL